MLDITTSRPSVGAYRCEPYSIAEIDAHPDCDRIWATVVALRENVSKEIEEDNAAYIHTEDDVEGAASEAREEAKRFVLSVIDNDALSPRDIISGLTEWAEK